MQIRRLSFPLAELAILSILIAGCVVSVDVLYMNSREHNDNINAQLWEDGISELNIEQREKLWHEIERNRKDFDDK